MASRWGAAVSSSPGPLVWLALGILCVLGLLSLVPPSASSTEQLSFVPQTSHTPLILGRYLGPQWWKANQTLQVKTLIETPFARVQLHRVQTEDSKRVIDDWLWVDERDAVNVLAQLHSGNQYVLFRQSKYGLDQESLAPVGGFINDGETAPQAAKRELNEELGLECPQWTALGRYRTAVNRGGGWLHAYSARDCVPAAQRKKTDDLEKQQVVQLDEPELLEALMRGKIGEVKWAAVIAISLLQRHYQQHQPPL